MSFIQIIEFQTSKPDEMRALAEKWRNDASGERTAARGTLCEDRERPGTFVNIVEFPSYDDAMRNSALPETNDFSQQMAALCDGPPTFRNLDIRDAWTG